MSTHKQRRALLNMVENGGNASKAMRDAGYSAATAKTPSKLTHSSGYQSLMDYYGLTVELIIEALVEDIKSKPGNRRAELELAVKIRGLSTNATVHVGPVAPQSLLKFMGRDGNVYDSVEDLKASSG